MNKMMLAVVVAVSVSALEASDLTEAAKRTNRRVSKRPVITNETLANSTGRLSVASGNAPAPAPVAEPTPQAPAPAAPATTPTAAATPAARPDAKSADPHSPTDRTRTVRNIEPQSSARNVTPESSVRNVTPESSVRNVTPESTVRTTTPESTARTIPPTVVPPQPPQ